MPHSHHGHARSHHHSGRDSNFYLYEEPEECVLVDGVLVCPSDTGSLDSSGNPKPGTLERRVPLPAGRYWFDAFGLNIPKADQWLKLPGAHVDATEHFPAETLSAARTWYLFTYKPVASIAWDTTLGYPTIADASIKSSQDTVSGADLPLNPLDELSNWMNSVEQKLGGSIGDAAKLVPYVAIGGVLVGGVFLLRQFGVLGKVKTSVKRLRRK